MTYELLLALGIILFVGAIVVIASLFAWGGNSPTADDLIRLGQPKRQD